MINNKNKYEIIVREIYQTEKVITAQSPDEAINIAQALYLNGDIELTEDDYNQTLVTLKNTTI